MNRIFDRVIRFDPLSRNFPIRTLVKDLPLRSYTWDAPIWLDQKAEGACVGFSVCTEAAARPVKVKGITNEVARSVYFRARELDEIPGEDYEGSSVLGGIKAGQERGWYPEYRWAFNLDDLLKAIGYKGPAVLGVNWYERMSEPTAEGIIRLGGSLLGGHAICLRGVNIRRGLARFRNSWGRQWGLDGDCLISFEDLNRLLNQQGEACIPVRRAYGPEPKKAA